MDFGFWIAAACYCIGSSLAAFIPVLKADSIFHFLNHFKPMCSIKGDLSKYKSPINIDTRKVVRTKIPDLIYTSEHWSCAVNFVLSNTNYYAEYTFDKKKDLSISSGPLCGKYKMYGFHFHWADAANNGAEHTVNHKKDAAEVHLVYYNSKYDSFNTSLTSPNGIAVLGFFLKARKGKRNEQFAKLTADVVKVQKQGPKVNVSNLCLDIFKPVALSRRYYHYMGSLTVQGGNPASWIVFSKPIYIINEQLDVFRNMRNSEGRPLSNVYPIQPLNGRTVYESIRLL